jgi:integrase
MSKKKANGISRHRGWWVIRYREKVGVGGEIRTVQRARRLAPISSLYKTPASVEHLAKEWRPAENDRRVSPLTVTTFGDFCERVYFPFVEEHKRPSTLHGYKQIWRCYLKHTKSNLEVLPATAWLREVRTCHVQQWLEAIAKDHGVSKTTLKHVKHFLSGVFRYAAQQDYLDPSRGNPVTLSMIPANAPEGEEGEAYSLKEVNKMLEVLLDPANTVAATAAYGGFREGELRGLVWEGYAPADDEESLGMLYVTRNVWRRHVGNPKTKRSKAPVPVIPQLAERLAAYRKNVGNPSTGPIFSNTAGRPLNLDWLYRTRMKDVLSKAGIEWKGWHAFRRGLASNLNRLGIDDSVIQAILRHSNIAVTQACYIKTASPDAVAAMRKLSQSMASSRKSRK